MHGHAIAAPLVRRAWRRQALNRIPPGRQPSAIEMNTEPQPAGPKRGPRLSVAGTTGARRRSRRSCTATAGSRRFRSWTSRPAACSCRAHSALRQGTMIEIELLSGHRLAAKVVWSLGSRIGAQFTPVLSPDIRALSRSSARSPDRPTTPAQRARNEARAASAHSSAGPSISGRRSADRGEAQLARAISKPSAMLPASTGQSERSCRGVKSWHAATTSEGDPCSCRERKRFR